MNVTGEFGHASTLPYVQTSQTLHTRYNFNFVDYSRLEFMTIFLNHFYGLTPPESMTELLIRFRGGSTPPEFITELLIRFYGLAPQQFMTELRNVL